jgi:hypothetical protein
MNYRENPDMDMVQIRQLVAPDGQHKKLQYRYKTPHAEFGMYGAEYYPPKDWGWSDWIDVPQVLDDTK